MHHRVCAVVASTQDHCHLRCAVANALRQRCCFSAPTCAHGLKRSSFWLCCSNKCAVYATQWQQTCCSCTRADHCCILYCMFQHISQYIYACCMFALLFVVATNLRRITLHVCGNSNKLLPQMRKTHTRAHRYNSWCSHAATTTYLFYLLNKLHTLHWLLPLLGQLPAPVALLGGACTPLLCSALELFIAVVVAAAAGRSLFSLLMLACFAMMTHGAPHIWYNAAVSCRCTCLPLLLLSQIVGNAIFTFIAY